MVNTEHLKMLRQGVKAWNKWRHENKEFSPDLSRTNLSRADLRRANLIRVRLVRADLRGANLSKANLMGADLSGANLSGANLTGANLSGANLSEVKLRGADLSTVIFRRTLLGNTDLSKTIGLESVKHNSPSTIGIDTFFRSKGKIPEVFLRGSGVPDIFLEYGASLTAQPMEFYSCFISYSSKDKALAHRLYADLQSKGVRCWFAPEDIRIGDRFRNEIDRAIRVHDRVLLLLSVNSVLSAWVEKEVETAFERERRDKRTILFPIRLDDAIMKLKTGWAAATLRSRQIGDFTNWKNHNDYQKAFSRLLRDLHYSSILAPHVKERGAS